MMHVDVAVIGGGIAGLWTLAKLRLEGYSAILIERQSIGGVQSIASQGIIHGGTKYALGGKLGDSAKAIGDMPAIWTACLQGVGEVDLSRVKVLAPSQLMWSTQGMISRVAGFFAGKLMQDRMQLLQPSDYPAPFDHEGFKGAVYQLNEPVLDTASLMQVFYEQLRDYCIHGEVRFEDKSPLKIQLEDADGVARSISCEQVILAAGEGNETLLKQAGRSAPRMQRRPVHMVMVRGELPPVYAHCLAGSSSPRLTITSSVVGNDTVWYVGGGVSETGVNRNRDEQIRFCRQELQEVLPWLDFSGMKWSTQMLNRAEIQTSDGKRPATSFAIADEGVVTVWPTKLAFAPKVAEQVIAQLRSAGFLATEQQLDLSMFRRPELACWPWTDTQWS